MGEPSRHAGALPLSSDEQGRAWEGLFLKKAVFQPSIVDPLQPLQLAKKCFQNFASTVSCAFCHAHEQGTVRNFDLGSYRSE